MNENADMTMLLSICKNRTNNSSHQPKLRIKAKQKRTTYKKQKLKLKKKITNNKPNKNKQKRIQPSTHRKKSHNSITKRKRTSTLTHSPRQQQQKLKIDKTKSSRNRKKNPMTLHETFAKNKKPRGNSRTRTIKQQTSNSPSKSPTTPASSPQSRQEPEAKEHIFEKRDRTTSLMALQALAEKIAIYKEKYGDIETRHSSILTPPKPNKRQKQRKK